MRDALMAISWCLHVHEAAVLLLQMYSFKQLFSDYVVSSKAWGAPWLKTLTGCRNWKHCRTHFAVL